MRRRVLLEKLIVVQIVKSFPALYQKGKVVTMVTGSLTSPYSEPDESSSCTLFV
jgi:hypothetical protein